MAGIAFAFNGLSLNCLMWPNNIAALGWMPWVVWRALQAWRLGGRQIVVAAILGALQLLAGAPEIWTFTWLILGAIWLADLCPQNSRRWGLLRRFLALLALIIGLSAAQLLPFFELVQPSPRGAEYAA